MVVRNHRIGRYAVLDQQPPHDARFRERPFAAAAAEHERCKPRVVEARRVLRAIVLVREGARVDLKMRGVEAMSRALQTLGEFDLKTSSWIATPAAVRKLGGALFCDRRYGQVFVYHNGAQAYYASRGFRGVLRV